MGERAPADSAFADALAEMRRDIERLSARVERLSVQKELAARDAAADLELLRQQHAADMERLRVTSREELRSAVTIIGRWVDGVDAEEESMGSHLEAMEGESDMRNRLEFLSHSPQNGRTDEHLVNSPKYAIPTDARPDATRALMAHSPEMGRTPAGADRMSRDHVGCSRESTASDRLSNTTRNASAGHPSTIAESVAASPQGSSDETTSCPLPQLTPLFADQRSPGKPLWPVRSGSDLRSVLAEIRSELAEVRSHKEPTHTVQSELAEMRSLLAEMSSQLSTERAARIALQHELSARSDTSTAQTHQEPATVESKPTCVGPQSCQEGDMPMTTARCRNAAWPTDGRSEESACSNPPQACRTACMETSPTTQESPSRRRQGEPYFTGSLPRAMQELMHTSTPPRGKPVAESVPEDFGGFLVGSPHP